MTTPQPGWVLVDPERIDSLKDELERVKAELERCGRDGSEATDDASAWQSRYERVKAERDHYRFHFDQFEARLDKALAALREIGCQHELAVTECLAHPDRRPDYCVRCAAIAEIEGRYDDVPGAGQRGC